MNEGRCVLTYNWGESFKAQNKSAKNLGVTPIPGSTHVYDRESKELVRCNKELCGVFDKD